MILAVRVKAAIPKLTRDDLIAVFEIINCIV